MSFRLRTVYGFYTYFGFGLKYVIDAKKVKGSKTKMPKDAKMIYVMFSGSVQLGYPSRVLWLCEQLKMARRGTYNGRNPIDTV